jgi:hypothetical protein
MYKTTSGGRAQHPPETFYAIETNRSSLAHLVPLVNVAKDEQCAGYHEDDRIGVDGVIHRPEHQHARRIVCHEYAAIHDEWRKQTEQQADEPQNECFGTDMLPVEEQHGNVETKPYDVKDQRKEVGYRNLRHVVNAFVSDGKGTTIHPINQQIQSFSADTSGNDINYHKIVHDRLVVHNFCVIFAACSLT